MKKIFQVKDFLRKKIKRYLQLDGNNFPFHLFLYLSPPSRFLSFLFATINPHRVRDYDRNLALVINPSQVRGSYVIYRRRVSARSALIYL